MPEPSDERAPTGIREPQRPQQAVLGRSRLGRRDQFVQAPAGLVEQPRRLVEQRDTLSGRHGPHHEMPNDLDHRRAQHLAAFPGAPGYSRHQREDPARCLRRPERVTHRAPPIR